MKKFFKWVGIVLLVAVALPVLWFFYQGYTSRHSFNQKLTVEIETPAGVRTGSSIVSVVIGRYSFVIGQPGGRAYKTLKGEAAVVEVLPERYLIALLKDQDSLAQKVFVEEISQFRADFNQFFGKLSRLRKSREVPANLYPMLVTFTDINDPSTVKRVDPYDLESHFGAGVRLKGVSLEVTREKVTRGRVEKFAFMKKLKIQSTLSGLVKFDESRPDPINYLTDKAFIAGDK